MDHFLLHCLVKSEDIVLFCHKLADFATARNRHLTRRLVLDKVLLWEERFLIRGVVPRVAAFDDSSVLPEHVPEGLHTALVISIRGSYKSALRHAGLLEQPPEVVRVLITHDLRVFVAELICFLLDLETMFISANRKEAFAILVLQLIEAMYRITVERCVQVANVRLSVDVEDGRHHGRFDFRTAELSPRLDARFQLIL